MNVKILKHPMTIAMAVIITILIVVGAMFSLMTSKTVQINLNIIKFNCQQSGGSWNTDQCNCSADDDEKYQYDLETGYCISEFGIPGGQLGETAKKLQELEMLKNQK
jgi:hypothetical protein